MKKTSTYHVNAEGVLKAPSFLSEFASLVKMRLTLMVVFTSIASYVIVAGFSAHLIHMLVLGIGGFCVAGASNVLNQVLEKDHDKLMKRTADRPVASGRMSISNAVMIAGFLCLVGVTLLSMFNPLTGFLGMISLVTYAFVYTPLKRHSSVAVLIGAIPGAMPMMIGCVAFEGHISLIALILFIIQFLWQIPHFWAIAFLSFEDYQNAGYKFIPTHNGNLHNQTYVQSIVTALALVPVGYFVGFALDVNMISIALLMIAGVIFTVYAIRFYRNTNRKRGLALMFASLLYLPFVLMVLTIDQLLF